MNTRGMIAGSAVGLAAGLLTRLLARDATWPAWVVEHVAGPVGQIFLRLLFLLIIPLVFAALVSTLSLLDVQQLGRLGARSLAYASGLSLTAALIGLALVNLIRPGAGEMETLRELARASVVPAVSAAERSSPADMIVAFVPDNPFKAAAAGDLIGIVVFSVVFALALSRTRSLAAAQLQTTIQGLYDVMMTCVAGVLKLAPVGVAALLFVACVKLGGAFLGPLAAYVATVLLGLTLHVAVVYGLLIRIVARRSPAAFLRSIRAAMLTAFTTSSSAATLPTTLRVADRELGLPPAVSRFVLTVGSNMNQNGTALYEGVTVLFLARVSAVDLSLGQQGLVMAICVLAGIGGAGVPGGTLPVMAVILGLFDIPLGGLVLVMGVDRLLDMCRTTVNVAGDLVVAACLAEPPDGQDRRG